MARKLGKWRCSNALECSLVISKFPFYFCRGCWLTCTPKYWMS
jgi:hypothetical protein